MAFSSALCLITLKVMKARGIEHPGNRNFKETMQNRKFGLLIHCIFGALALSLWLRNSAYFYTSVAFMQVLKITFHIAVAVLENVFENGATQYKMLLSTITLGVIVASYGEVMNLIGDVKEKVAIMVDDMIDIAG
ncbi:probable sugar phosphate/phosphate translocator At3g14410 [Asparagus officinalis]|uniref:probable sugar phosphate/phosphate translocator At3g14410 n=1 Tax=Asparagus officinalis TaxID=4686 RepID=UPI00098E85F3|nr:probable sugar phosphate/phosphate translocator At3g14410 [Asparagus officinalis]